jgi:hypothetical protein
LLIEKVNLFAFLFLAKVSLIFTFGSVFVQGASDIILNPKEIRKAPPFPAKKCNKFSLESLLSKNIFNEINYCADL